MSEGNHVPPAPAPPPQVNLVDLIRVLADKADAIIRVWETASRERRVADQAEMKYQKHMALIAVLMTLAIVGVAAFLTYKGKIDGSTFTFLLGLIVGYVLTFIRDQITGTDN